MMPTEHDEALVERVALALYTDRGFISTSFDTLPNKGYWLDRAREVIYPPAPPKTRLQVARELLASCKENQNFHGLLFEGKLDNAWAMQAVLAALALPAMED